MAERDGGFLRDDQGRPILKNVAADAPKAVSDVLMAGTLVDAEGREIVTIEGVGTSSDVASRALKANLPVNVKDYGAVGDGVADDTPAIVNALAALPTTGDALGGTVFLPTGVYKVTAQIVLTYNQRLRGAGRGEFLQAYGATTIKSTFNGAAIHVPEGRYGWAITDLNITGDRALASQDLLKIGSGNNVLPSLQGDIERVYVSQAGRDNIVLDDALHVHMEGVYSHKAKRYCLRAEGQSNSNKFTKCQFREADQDGVYWRGGYGGVFDTCTIESNNRDAAGTYGGVLVDPNDADTAAHISLSFNGCHFEENSKTTGYPVKVLTGIRDVSISEDNSLYVETDATRQVLISRGEWTSTGIQTNLTTHASLTGTHPVVFDNPHKIGSGSFAVSGTNKRVEVRTVDQWHEVGAAGEPVFDNGWVNFGIGFNTAAFKKIGNIVHIKGTVKNGTVATRCFLLPAGYRPPLNVLRMSISNDVIGRLQIASTGDVICADNSIGNNTWFSIECSFGV